MQKIDFYGDHGKINRSSAIFYFKSDADFSTDITVLNYWKHKSGIEVEINLTIRDLSGKTIRSSKYNFGNAEVLSFNSNELLEGRVNFEGSVEVEAFSDTDLRIPYAAIMAHYQAPNSHSLTHSYARTFNQSELVTEKNVIVDGEEGCWILHDSELVTSMAIIHNGTHRIDDFFVDLEVTNASNDTLLRRINFGTVLPYQTLKIIPKMCTDELVSFLGGKAGFASLSFKFKDSFTRALICRYTDNFDEFQSTHSNFNYAKKDPGESERNGKAVMHLPDYGADQSWVVVYPSAASKQYRISIDDGSNVFNWGIRKIFLKFQQILALSSRLSPQIKYYRIGSLRVFVPRVIIRCCR